MIGPGTDARVLVATRPVDFRKGADSLAAIVKSEYGADPFSGVVYVFRAKRADRIKLVWWEGTGLCLHIHWVRPAHASVGSYANHRPAHARALGLAHMLVGPQALWTRLLSMSPANPPPHLFCTYLLHLDFVWVVLRLIGLRLSSWISFWTYYGLNLKVYFLTIFTSTRYSVSI